LYHLLAGNPPFYDSDLRPEKAHEKSRVPPIRAGEPIPRKLWEVVRKMLAKRPGDRYATPADVAADQTPFTDGNDLVALVKGYVQPTEGGSATQHTRTDSGARIDTWLSRVSDMYPDRRWMLSTGLPLLLAALGVAALWWTSQRSRRLAIDRAREQAEITLPSLAERVAQEDVSAGLTKRFQILQAAAAEPELLAMIERFDPAEVKKTLEEHELQVWIREHRRENMDRASSDSWFINDRTGLQIARHPLIDDETNAPVDSFLNSYAYRNYFHGQNRDLEPGEAVDVEPVTEPNLSAVYISSTTNQLKVALSVPVWSKPAEGKPPEVVAVLAMSVGLEAFEVLSPKKLQGKDIIIADMRDDYFEQDSSQPGEDVKRRGMILQHPLRASWKNEVRKPRLAPEVLAAATQAPSGFVADYHDPLAADPRSQFWGAYEPVEFQVTDQATGERKSVPSGWIVLTQLRAID